MIKEILASIGLSKNIPSNFVVPSKQPDNSRMTLSAYADRRSKVQGSRMSKYSNHPSTMLGIPLEEFEQAYYTDSISFNTINILSNTMWVPGYRIIMDDDNQQKLLEKWLDFIKLDKFMLEYIRYTLIYGTGYLEKVRNQITGKIESYVLLDPKKMIIEWDEYGNVVRYRQKTEGGQFIDFEPEKIICMKFFSLPDTLYGFSIITPIYDSIIDKKQVEQGTAKSIERHGFPLWHVKLGTPEHPVEGDEFTKWRNYLTNINAASNEWVTNPFVEIKELNSGKDIKATDYLDYFIRLETVGYGVPEELLGSNLGSSYATSYTKLESFERQIKTYQLILKDVMLENIFKDFKKDYNIPEEFSIDIEFEEFNPEDQNQEVARMVSLVNAGIITKEEAREELGYPEMIQPNPITPVFPRVPTPTIGQPSDKPTPPPSFFSKSKVMNELMTLEEFAEVKQYLPFIETKLDELNKETESTIHSELEKAYAMGKMKVHNKKELALNVEDEAAIAWLKQHAMWKFEDANKKIRNDIKEIIMTSIEKGWSVFKTRNEILKVFEVEKGRAEMIARTEISRAMNAGTMQTYKEDGIKTIEWLTASDEKVCPICGPQNGRKFNMNKQNGKYEYRNEPIEIPAHPNCRCTTLSGEGLGD